MARTYSILDSIKSPSGLSYSESMVLVVKLRVGSSTNPVAQFFYHRASIIHDGQ